MTNQIFSSSFNDWLCDFSSNHGHCLKGLDVKNWLAKVENGHQDIRKFLGGNALQVKVDLDKDVNEKIPTEEVYDFVQKLHRLIPDYFAEYGVATGHFCYEKVPFGVKPQKGMAWGKHISGWAKKNKIAKDIQDQLPKLSCELGQIYAKNSISKDTYYVTLTTEPQAFFMLGHYSADMNTCFRSSGLNEAHRYIIGQTENTFIGLVSKSPLEENNVAATPKMRFWGVAGKNFDRFHVCNIYPRNPNDQGNVYKSIHKTFETILKEPVQGSPHKFRVRGVFFNKESPVTYHPKSLDISETNEVFYFDYKSLNRYRKCFHCATGGTDDYPFVNVDYKQFCPRCAEGFVKFCDFSKERTEFGLTCAYQKGKATNVSEISLREHFRQCNENGEYHHIDDVEKVGKKYFLKKTLVNAF